MIHPQRGLLCAEEKPTHSNYLLAYASTVSRITGVKFRRPNRPILARLEKV